MTKVYIFAGANVSAEIDKYLYMYSLATQSARLEIESRRRREDHKLPLSKDAGSAEWPAVKQVVRKVEDL